MNPKFKLFGSLAAIGFAAVLLYRRRRAFKGARGYLLLLRLLVAAGEAWREARLRRRLEAAAIARK